MCLRNVKLANSGHTVQNKDINVRWLETTLTNNESASEMYIVVNICQAKYLLITEVLAL